jgi:alkyldihydroxyacetonephosphate synthase
MAVSEAQRTRKFWGWGYEGEGLSDAEIEDIGREMRARFNVESRTIAAVPALGSIDLPEARLAPPQSLESRFLQETPEPAIHNQGK